MCGFQQETFLYHLDQCTGCTACAAQCEDYPVYCGLGAALIAVGKHIAAIVDHNALRHEEGELEKAQITDLTRINLYYLTYANGNQPCVQAGTLQSRT